jgi:hypothetical protein
MALLTAQGIARVAITLLNRTLVLPRTVTLVPADGFTGPNGETITVRVRTPRTAREQANPGDSITYDDAAEVGVDVALSHLYDAYHITDEDLSLALENFASQITEPQVASVATGAEDKLAAVMNGLSPVASFASTPDPDDTDAQIMLAREILSDNLVPASGRWLACSPQVISRLLGVEKFVRADAMGDGPSSALRDAVIGRIYGFTVVESPGLDNDTACAYHSSGFVFATKKPADPRGATETAAITSGGINIRQIFQYDPDVLSDASVLSTFAGASEVLEDGSGGSDAKRFYKLDSEAS